MNGYRMKSNPVGVTLLRRSRLPTYCTANQVLDLKSQGLIPQILKCKAKNPEALMLDPQP